MFKIVQASVKSFLYRNGLYRNGLALTHAIILAEKSMKPGVSMQTCIFETSKWSKLSCRVVNGRAVARSENPGSTVVGIICYPWLR